MKSKRMIIAAAIITQVLLFGLYYYIDGKMIIAGDTLTVWRVSFHPATILFYGLTPFLMWWSYRVIYSATGGRFWMTLLIEGLLLQVVHLVASYLSTHIQPTKAEWAGLGLSFLATLVAGWK